MGNRPRSGKTRRHRHSDSSRTLGVQSEDELYQLLDELTSPPLLLILDNVQDPHNLGACLRTADAAGVNAVVLPKDRSVGLTETVRLVACGAVETVPVVQVTNLARCMGLLKERGVWLVGTADAAEKSLYQIDLAGSLGIVMGAEGKGLRRLVAEQCDFLVSIPMAGSVPCLNVSVAAGVCLFEVVRRRLQGQ